MSMLNPFQEGVPEPPEPPEPPFEVAFVNPDFQGGYMADHKAEETNTTGSTLLGERVKSVAAIVAALYFVLNTVLGSFGVNPLPFTNEEVSAAVSSVGAVVMTIIVWWRQNVITKAADAGHRLTTAIKTGQVAAVQGTSQPTEDTGAAGEPDAAGDMELDEVTGTPVIHVGE